MYKSCMTLMSHGLMGQTSNLGEPHGVMQEEGVIKKVPKHVQDKQYELLQ